MSRLKNLGDGRYEVRLPSGEVFFLNTRGVNPYETLAEKAVAVLIEELERKVCLTCAVRRARLPPMTPERLARIEEAQRRGVEEVALDRDRSLAMLDEGCPNGDHDDIEDSA